jgi:hypothetical protein
VLRLLFFIWLALPIADLAVNQGVKDETWKREIKLLKSCCDKALESIHVVREALEKAKAELPKVII